MDTIDGFRELFQGNKGAIGTEEGGCLRFHPWSVDLFEDNLSGHLDGSCDPVGVYPMVSWPSPRSDRQLPPSWRVKWGCIDFDEGEEESWLHAKNVHLALQTFGITGWIERSRSKGYHVWVFTQDWTEAWLMRRALLAACQIVEAPTKEINPKQTELAEGQLGNYVRLPYPGWLASRYVPEPPYRRMIVNYDHQGVMSLERFVAHALDKRTDVAALEKLAAYYKPPVKPMRTRDWGHSAFAGAAVDRLLGKARIIWEQGPLEGGDRSDTLYKLAMYLREDGRHTRGEAYDLLADADERWGKFSTRPDCEARLNDLLDKAGFG